MEFPLLLGRVRDARRMAIEESDSSSDHLLSLFDRDDPRRAEQKYLLFRSKLIWYFDRHNCECPEDLADETVCRIVNAMAKGTQIYVENPFAFFWAVAENVHKEHWKRHKSEPLESHHSVPAASYSNPEKAIYLRECLRAALSPDEQNLLESYYRDGSGITAKRLGITLPNLRLKIHRIRSKVKKFAESGPGQAGASA